MPTAVDSFLTFINRYGTMVGIVLLAYLQTLFPSRDDFNRLVDKFETIEKQLTTITVVQQSVTQQQVKIVDIELRLRQLELDIVKLQTQIDVKPRQ